MSAALTVGTFGHGHARGSDPAACVCGHVGRGSSAARRWASVEAHLVAERRRAGLLPHDSSHDLEAAPAGAATITPGGTR